jgi:hypothetical protein
MRDSKFWILGVLLRGLEALGNLIILEGSVSDSDSGQVIRIQSGQWNLIRNPDLDPGGQKYKSRTKIRNFMFWSAGCSLLSAEGRWRLLELGRPFWRPRDKKIVVFDFKKICLFLAVIFFTFYFLVIKILDPNPDRYLATDPKHCLKE